MLQSPEPVRAASPRAPVEQLAVLALQPGTDREWDPGEAIALDAGQLSVLTHGEVLVHRAGRPVDLWRAPCPLDLAGTVAGERNARFVAVTRARVHGVPRGAVDPAIALGALADEARRLWGRVEIDARRDDDTFLPSGLPVPGPWWFRRVRGVALIVQGDPRRLRRSLPPGASLMPGSEGRYVLVVSRLDGVGSHDPRDVRQFLYHEISAFIPVWGRGFGIFIPELYPDAWMAGILGREIHGFPKRTARIGIHEDGAELIVGQRLALRLRWEVSGACSPADALAGFGEKLGAPPWLSGATRWIAGRANDAGALGFPVLVRKRVPAASTAGATLETDALVRVPFGIDPITRAERVAVTEADFPSPAALDASGSMLGGTVVHAMRLETGFRFGAGTVVRRFARSR